MNLSAPDVNRPAMSLEPAWLPARTVRMHSSQRSQTGRAAVTMWETKLETPEKETTIDEVAAAILALRPAM